MIKTDTHALGPLMLDLEGLVLSVEERELLQRPVVGGVILFSRNFATRSQLLALIGEIRALRPDLLLAVDHEGGRVQRFRDGFTRIPPMRCLGELYRRQPTVAVELARDCGWLLAAELSACGIDLSFTPVLDLDYGCSSVIGDRAFSPQADEVVALSAALIEGLHEVGMPAIGKHFPGHGAVEADSHLESPEDPREFSAIAATDLVPFAALVPQGLDGVMPAHVRYSRCDSRPAGFSRFWLQRVLREQLGFQGVIFSDDLGMAGAGVAGRFSERADAALAAGCDMLLVCNDRAGALEVADHLAVRPDLLSSRVAALRRPAGGMSWASLEGMDRWRRTREALVALEGGV